MRKVSVIKQSYGFGYDTIGGLKKDLNRDLKSFNERLDCNLNIDFDGRSIVNDDPNDLNDRNYGNNNVMPKKGRSHGTHVSGIIAATRNNGIGINGAANNVKIMAIRNTPNGDEYDKDVALGVYYAVDNGAKVINMSFGKGFSNHSDWVRDAIAYAAKNNVLICGDKDGYLYFLNREENSFRIILKTPAHKGRIYDIKNHKKGFSLYQRFNSSPNVSSDDMEAYQPKPLTKH